MKTSELLDEVKKKLGVSSDYALCKALDIPTGKMSDYRNGKRVPDNYACFKFAEVLGKSPSEVIAGVLAENEKNSDKRLFYKSFLTAVGLWIILAVIPVSLGGFSSNAQAAGKAVVIDLTGHYTK